MTQDPTFLKEWKLVSDAFDIPIRDMVTINLKLKCGNISIYDVTQWMLQTWSELYGKSASANKLIETLKIIKLQNAAGKKYQNNMFINVILHYKVCSIDLLRICCVRLCIEKTSRSSSVNATNLAHIGAPLQEGFEHGKFEFSKFHKVETTDMELSQVEIIKVGHFIFCK